MVSKCWHAGYFLRAENRPISELAESKPAIWRLTWRIFISFLRAIAPMLRKATYILNAEMLLSIALNAENAIIVLRQRLICAPVEEGSK